MTMAVTIRTGKEGLKSETKKELGSALGDGINGGASGDGRADSMLTILIVQETKPVVGTFMFLSSRRGWTEVEW